MAIDSRSSTTVTMVALRFLCLLPMTAPIADISSREGEEARLELSQNASTSMFEFLMGSGLDPLTCHAEVMTPIGEASDKVLAEAVRLMMSPIR